MEGMFDGLKGRIAVRDWRKLKQLIDRLLGGEAEFAHLISSSLKRLADMTTSASSPDDLRKARGAARRTRDNHQDLRRRLLEHHLKFYEVI
jgi:hypothetical protein